MSDLYGLGWWVIILPPLFLIQRQLHRELQEIFFLLSGRLEIALVLFSLIFFPGVFLHEASHYLAARFLGVKTGNFSIWPRIVKKGKLQLGYVETAQSDLLREAIIGAAPLLTGCGLIVYIGISRLGLTSLWHPFVQQMIPELAARVVGIYRQPDFWLWFYLLLVVSSTMFPSRSDQRAWLPLTFFVIVLVGIAAFSGAGEWMYTHLKPWAGLLFSNLTSIFAISLLVHLVCYLPLPFIRQLIFILKRD